MTRAGNGITKRLPIPRTELFFKSVFYKGSKLWNDLNEDIRNITELSEFEKNKTLMLCTRSDNIDDTVCVVCCCTVILISVVYRCKGPYPQADFQRICSRIGSRIGQF